MKWLFVSCVALCIAVCQVNSQACHLREVDLCVAIGMFHFQSNGIASDDAQVSEWCETLEEVQQCMGNFTEKCLSPLQRELLGLMAGSDEIGKEFCTPGSEIRTNYLSKAECLAEGYESDEFKNQMKDVQVVLEKLFDVVFKERFPLMCCGFRRFHEKTEDIIGKRCGEDSVSMLRNVLKTVTTNLPETICQRFDPESEECTALLPPTGTPSKGADNKTQLGKLMDTVFGNL